MRNLEAANTPIDVVTVEGEIEKAGKLDAIGGIAFLGELALCVPTPDNVLAYAREVEDKSRIRQLGQLAAELSERCFEQDLEVDEYFGEALRKIGEIDRAKPDEAKPIGEYVKKRVLELEDLVRARESGKQVTTGIPSGLKNFDAKIGGYPKGDLIIIAARPAMGKTAMAMSAVDAATAAGIATDVYAAEGGWRMFADRMISRASGIPVARLRNAELGGGDAQALANAQLRYHNRKNLFLDTRASLRATDIIRCVRRHKAERGTKLVVVDYVQMLRRPKGLEHDENAALDATITALAQAAIDDDITYLVLSQLNREVERRNDKRPIMSDLRGSGALEERPRMIVSPFRSSYYYPAPQLGIDYECNCIAGDGEGQELHVRADDAAFKRQVQVLVLKNSNGPTGFVRATWNGETAGMS
jgi:replicative DNA helicase